MAGTATVAGVISVIVPVLNPGIELADALASVTRWLPEAEVVVVDDGSTVPVERATVRQPNAGPAAARNAGARAASGDWLVFLDGDDVMLAGAKRFADIASGRVGMVSGGVVRRADGIETPSAPNVHEFGVRFAVTAGSFAVRRDIFDAVGGYDQALRFSENTDLAIRCAAECVARGVDVIAFDEPTVTYEQPDSAKYDGQRLASVEHVLRRGRPDLARAEVVALLHRIAAVDARKTRRYVVAGRHAVAYWRVRLRRSG